MAMIRHDTSNKNYAVVNIALDKLTPAKDGDGIRGMVHGYNQDGHFGITENVRLYDTKGLDNFVNTGLLLGFASTVLAQKHLADISKKLDEIKIAVEQVSQFQKNERKAKINSAYQICVFIVNGIKDGYEIPNGEVGKLNNIYTEISAILEHLKKDLSNLSGEIRKIKFDEFLNRSNTKNLKELNDKFINFRELSYQYNLCCDIIILANNLLGYMSKNDNDISYYNRVNIDFFSMCKEFVDDLNSDIENHLKYIENSSKSITNFDSTDSANRAFFQSRLQELNLQKIFVEKKEETLKNPNNISVKVLIDNGNIIDGELLVN